MRTPRPSQLSGASAPGRKKAMGAALPTFPLNLTSESGTKLFSHYFWASTLRKKRQFFFNIYFLHFYSIVIFYRLACCRAAVRWVCGLVVRQRGHQAVDGSLYFARLLTCDLIEKSAKVTTYYFNYFFLGKTHFHHCLCYRWKETI